MCIPSLHLGEILHITCCERITWRRDCTQAATRDFPKRKRDDDKPVVLYIPLTLSEHCCPPLSQVMSLLKSLSSISSKRMISIPACCSLHLDQSVHSHSIFGTD